jgi:hypothetical protein
MPKAKVRMQKSKVKIQKLGMDLLLLLHFDF